MCWWLNFLFCTLSIFFPLWLLSLFSFFCSSCLLSLAPHFTLGLYVVFSRLVKLASVNLTHSLSLSIVFIFHSTSGCAIFKRVNISNPANAWAKPSLFSPQSIHQRYISLWFMLEHTVHKPPKSLWGKFPSVGHIHSQPPGTNHFPHTSGAVHCCKKAFWEIPLFPKHSPSKEVISFTQADCNWDRWTVKILQHEVSVCTCGKNSYNAGRHINMLFSWPLAGIWVISDDVWEE